MGMKPRSLCIDKVPTMWYAVDMKQSKNFRLSEEAWSLLSALAVRHGIARTAVLEMLIREAARQQGIHADSGLQTQSEPGASRSH